MKQASLVLAGEESNRESQSQASQNKIRGNSIKIVNKQSRSNSSQFGSSSNFKKSFQRFLEVDEPQQQNQLKLPQQQEYTQSNKKRSQSTQSDVNQIRNFGQNEKKQIVHENNELNACSSTQLYQSADIKNIENVLTKKEKRVSIQNKQEQSLNRKERFSIHVADKRNQNSFRSFSCNFKIKQFSEQNLMEAINALTYGTLASLCIPSRKISRKILLVMSDQNQEQIKIIDIANHSQKQIHISKIKDIEYSYQNQAHSSIRGIDSQRLLSFIVAEKEEVECLLQFQSSEIREVFMQGFQFFVQQSLQTQFLSGNILQFRSQIEKMIQQQKGKKEKTYDIQEVVELFSTKVQLSISKSYLKKICSQGSQKELNNNMFEIPKIDSTDYLSNEHNKSISQQKITDSQLLSIIDEILDRQELYSVFQQITDILDVRVESRIKNCLTIEGFKKFILIHQKETIFQKEIETLFQDVLDSEKRQMQESIELNEEINKEVIQDNEENKQGNSKRNSFQEALKKGNFDVQSALSFNGFVRFIFSKNNSIFDPQKEFIYQVDFCFYMLNMDKPITEYYVNSAKNIYHANFDILTMTQLAGRRLRNQDSDFPLLYALSRGARYIEVQVWDGDNEPVIIYGPTMNSKLNISYFLKQLIKIAFLLSPFPLFLNIVSHCSIKQNFKMKYLIDTIISDSLFVMPLDYKERIDLPSPNDLKYKIILIGRLPHQYDEILQETYTYNDIIKSKFSLQLDGGNPLLIKEGIGLNTTSRDISSTQPILNPLGRRKSIGMSQREINSPNNNLINSGQCFSCNQSMNNNQKISSASVIQSNSPNQLLSQSGTFFESNNNLLYNQNKGVTQQIMTIQQQQQMQGQISQQNRSTAYVYGQIDGALLTPVHVLSYHNLPEGDSLDQEMMEFILKEELEDEGGLGINAGSTTTAAIESNNALTSCIQNSINGNTGESGQPSKRRFGSNSSQIIDQFFQKTYEQPKFKKFLQLKFDEQNEDLPIQYQDRDCSSQGIQQEQQDNESSMTYNYPDNIVMITPRETSFSKPSYRLQIGKKRKNEKGKDEKIIEFNSENGLLKGDKQNQNNNCELHQTSISLNVSAASPQGFQSQRDLKYLQEQGFGNLIASNSYQVQCIRDYSPVHASNSIESLFGMYICKSARRRPSLWEIYEFSSREFMKFNEKPPINSVLFGFSSFISFTSQHLTIVKPQCKTADSINFNPLPFFSQGFQFTSCFLHTFDKYSLIYQSIFNNNGGEACGYILKPRHLRNQIYKHPKKSSDRINELTLDDSGSSKIKENLNSQQVELDSQNTSNFSSQKKSSKEEVTSKHQSPNKINSFKNPLNSPLSNNKSEEEEDSCIDSQNKEEEYENEDKDDDLQTLYRASIKIISGYNLPTNQSDKINPFVQIIVVNKDSSLSFQTNTVENNCMKPLWLHEIKFKIVQSQLCFIVFQCINSTTNNLLGWYSIPFNCMRQGIRAVPLRDGFFNYIKNSFILCDISIIKEKLI